MTRPVLLVHGLWMRSFVLLPLARRLRGAGFDCRRFDYPTLRGGPEPAVTRLCEQLHAAAPNGCDLVAHSLGGLVALRALACAPDTPVHRVVCLGSPLRGSQSATGLAGWRLGLPLLGLSRELLCTGVPDWAGRAEVGMIAGNVPLGAGRVLGGLPLPHDGTVCVAETRLAGLSDHIELPTTHTGMLFSPEVARQTIAFLRHGRFDHASQAPSTPGQC